MRRAMSYVAPWAGVTALAVALSWLGVRDVVRGAVSERSAPPPIAGPVIHSSPAAPPGPPAIGSPTARPKPPDGADRAPTPTKPAKPPPPGKPSKTPPKTPDNVRSYATRGGRAAMSIEKDRVRLVSATPNPGYETRVTQAEGWLRVDFLTDEHTSSVIASWYEHEPMVKVYEY
ncbi:MULTISPECIES: hypothetical protein [Actinomadura]|uniref:Secreted protein n=1 Tax=Actinomadura geliboluensis TaxID=882440 RepID=A0A5S4G7T1_9ACTN|nr:hypothetical protein [Actinomadura geliboluensis]TMR29077.1 hypothetical protein ETD96_36300 [Actinomadura geliboluensis]